MGGEWKICIGPVKILSNEMVENSKPICTKIKIEKNSSCPPFTHMFSS
jgi:hypothetical protein